MTQPPTAVAPCRCSRAAKGKLFNLHRLSHPSPTLTVPGASAGLQPSGDESDQLDQSAEITVIPEVRGRAAGHREFTHPAQALDKSV